MIPLQAFDVMNVTDRALASSFHPEQVAAEISDSLKKLLHVDQVGLILFEEEGQRLRCILSQAASRDDLTERSTALCMEARDTGLPVIGSDDVVQQGMKSVLFFPLKEGESVTAVLQLGSEQPAFFSEARLSALRLLSTGLAVSVRHAMVHEESKRKLNELAILYRMAKISTSLGLDQMLTEVVNDLNPLFKFENWGILVVDDNTRRLVPHSSFIGFSREETEGPDDLMGSGLPSWVAEKGEPFLLSGVQKGSKPIQGDERILSEMCVPLKAGEKVFGIIDAKSKKPNAFSENDFHLFKIVGENLSNLIENARSEERYRAVVEGALDGVMVLSEDERLTYVNDRVAEILGYSRDELSGMDFRVCLDEESRRIVAVRKEKRQRGEAVSPRVELKVLRKDRRVRNVEVSSTIIRESQGNTSTVAFMKDITEKRRMEERLLQAEKLRALGEMAGGVAHDFNTALAIILGNTQLLLSMVQDEEIKKGLTVIEKEAQESAETVRRLLEFTRKGVWEEVTLIDPNVVVKEAVESTQPRWKDDIQGKGLHVGMVLNLEPVPPVSGIASELKEVIAQLIINAVESMPDGGTIDIRTFEREGVCIQVSDSGTGMTEEVQRKVFEPFFTTQPFTHTGLGLSMSYGIVRRLGGGIEVESGVGEGSTFTISLPIAIEGEERRNQETGLKGRILLIDEKELERDDLSKILEKGRHHVVTAENGKKGIHLFHEREFDIVLTDLQDVCRTIKRMDPRTPIGMITKRGDGGIEKNKGDFLISPPFDMNQVLTKVAETLEFKGLAPSATLR